MKFSEMFKKERRESVKNVEKIGEPIQKFWKFLKDVGILENIGFWNKTDLIKIERLKNWNVEIFEQNKLSRISCENENQKTLKSVEIPRKVQKKKIFIVNWFNLFRNSQFFKSVLKFHFLLWFFQLEQDVNWNKVK